jgi:hypothetical protein
MSGIQNGCGKSSRELRRLVSSDGFIQLGLLFLFFLKVGAVLYGSGNVLLAFIRAALALMVAVTYQLGAMRSPPKAWQQWTASRHENESGEIRSWWRNSWLASLSVTIDWRGRLIGKVVPGRVDT